MSGMSEAVLPKDHEEEEEYDSDGSKIEGKKSEVTDALTKKI
jgi:hypothetical protein